MRGISRPVSNGPVAERSMTIDEGRTIASSPLMPSCTSRRAASAAGPLTTRAPGIGMALGPTLRTRQPRSGRMPSDPVPTGTASVMLDNATRQRLRYGAVWTHINGGARQRSRQHDLQITRAHACKRYAGQCTCGGASCPSRWAPPAGHHNDADTRQAGVLINVCDKA